MHTVKYKINLDDFYCFTGIICVLKKIPWMGKPKKLYMKLKKKKKQIIFLKLNYWIFRIILVYLSMRDMERTDVASSVYK